MRIAYLGNFGPSFSTETHVALSLKTLGHEVIQLQEGGTPASEVPNVVKQSESDVLLWTQTLDLAKQSGSRSDRASMITSLRSTGVPTFGFHLDRWWGLDREHLVREEPFFRVDRVFTADGGHEAEWAEEGIAHTWSPPGVYHGECVDVGPVKRYESDIAFVGAWQSYGHREWWPIRKAMLDSLKFYFGERAQFWPKGSAIRGMELTSLYQSAKVIVGDSCLPGGITHYWSDRVPETMGRGGFLLHPYVKGLDDFFEDGKHLRFYEHGNYEDLAHLIDYYIEHDHEREAIRRAGMELVRGEHTYLNRMKTVLGFL